MDDVTSTASHVPGFTYPINLIDRRRLQSGFAMLKNEDTASPPEGDQDLREWLIYYLQRYDGSQEAYDDILGRPRYMADPNEITQHEHHRIGLFRRLVMNLEEMLGGEEPARSWLFYDEELERKTGYVPFDFLYGGIPDTLELLSGLSEIAMERRRLPASNLSGEFWNSLFVQSPCPRCGLLAESNE